ncbi:hypothetical protein K438DRAFT_1823511 [Mycena galopus ATCC 62051]|nr:hypothetical protein K438DRAFT_1823511 [Mycena galopus ATCC 62051]
MDIPPPRKNARTLARDRRYNTSTRQQTEKQTKHTPRGTPRYTRTSQIKLERTPHGRQISEVARCGDTSPWCFRVHVWPSPQSMPPCEFVCSTPQETRPLSCLMSRAVEKWCPSKKELDRGQNTPTDAENTAPAPDAGVGGAGVCTRPTARSPGRSRCCLAPQKPAEQNNSGSRKGHRPLSVRLLQLPLPESCARTREARTRRCWPIEVMPIGITHRRRLHVPVRRKQPNIREEGRLTSA